MSGSLFFENYENNSDQLIKFIEIEKSSTSFVFYFKVMIIVFYIK